MDGRHLMSSHQEDRQQQKSRTLSSWREGVRDGRACCQPVTLGVQDLLSTVWCWRCTVVICGHSIRVLVQHLRGVHQGSGLPETKQRQGRRRGAVEQAPSLVPRLTSGGQETRGTSERQPARPTGLRLTLCHRTRVWERPIRP